MKKILMMLLILMILLSAIEIKSAQAASLKDNPRLAILPYADKASKSCGLNMQDATVVSEFLMEQFLDSMRFKIVEREKMQEILAEHSLQASGLVNPATAVAVGQLAGAQYLVAGSVTGLSSKKSGASYSNSEKGSIGFNSYTVIANITLRIIDIEDGTVVMAVSGTGESARTNIDVVLRQEIRNYYGDDGYDDEPNTAEPNTAEPNTDEPNTDEPNTDEPNTAEPNTDEPSTNEPSTNEPSTDEPSTDEPSTDEVETGNTSEDEENYSGDEEGEYYDEGEGGGYTTRTVTHRFTIGGQGYSMVQVRNALYKAAVDAVYNKNYGVLAKLDGKAKRRKV